MDGTQILVIVFGVIAVIFGIRWQNTKAFLKEAAEALTVVSAAITDDKLTKEEVIAIAQEFNDVILAMKKLIGK